MNPEVQKMIDHSFEYAKELLTDTKEFYPFGAFIDTIGNVHPLEFDFNPKQMPTVGTVLESLTKYCTEELKEGRVHAYGLTYEANIQLSEDENIINCIAIDLFHKDETDLPKIYMPYEVTENGELNFDEMFAVK